MSPQPSLRFVRRFKNRRPPRILHEQGIVEIPLTRGKIAIIDICDAERVLQHNWHTFKNQDGNYYACAKLKKAGIQATLYLHRFILGPPPHLEVDHKNGDGLDNRRSNLRLAARTQNCRNSKTPPRLIPQGLLRASSGTKLDANGVPGFTLGA